jgi:hypothetical protein
MFSESRDDKPEVGSSTNKTDGSLINSKPIFKRLRCPPEIVFSKGEPTFKSRVSDNPKSANKAWHFFAISSSDKLPKHNLAL